MSIWRSNYSVQAETEAKDDDEETTKDEETAQEIIVAELPINSVIDIKELNHDGYHASIKAIEGTTEVPLVQGDSYTINMITENKDIKVYNTPGVELPETGGIGTLIYIVVGLSMVLASAILSIAFIRSSKVSD